MPTEITSTSYMTPKAPGEAGTKKPGQMGKDDFLKIFVAQMQHQDPSKPMDDTAFMQQMASFSTLEQISNLATSSALVAQNLAQGNAISLIGRTVTYADEAGAVHTGKVEHVATVDGKGTLTVAGVPGVDPAWISQVA